MTRVMAALAVSTGLSVVAVASALAQEPACQPLYDAARKAQAQAGSSVRP